ncbi:MAG: pantoate--beta-alanine ligase [Rhodobacteraceae bacterium]|nr:pantoate--beta-alanine ligase [Paracoccaceae bacterium]
MKILETKQAVREHCSTLRKAGQSIALVPTMGFLHEGHLSLVREAARRCDVVVVSIFVNPTQFGPNEDLDSYPRDTERDLELLAREGVSGVFMPSVDEMYGATGDTFVEVPELSSILQGALRPDHFRGVSTVVSKLFNIVQPDVAVFGEKDYQQLAIIRQMVRDLDMPLAIVGHPTVREADGLAMSSRNVRLSEQQRAEAAALSQSMTAAETIASEGTQIVELKRVITEVIEENAPNGKIESVEIRDALTLAPLDGALDRPAVILLAVRFGAVLLIDQRVIDVTNQLG